MRSLISAHPKRVINDCGNNDSSFSPSPNRQPLERERGGSAKFRPVFEQRRKRAPSPARPKRNSVSSSLSLLLKVAKMPPAAAFMDNRPTDGGVGRDAGGREGASLQASRIFNQVRPNQRQHRNAAAFTIQSPDWRSLWCTKPRLHFGGLVRRQRRRELSPSLSLPSIPPPPPAALAVPLKKEGRERGES